MRHDNMCASAVHGDVSAGSLLRVQRSLLHGWINHELPTGEKECSAVGWTTSNMFVMLVFSVQDKHEAACKILYANTVYIHTRTDNCI